MTNTESAIVAIWAEYHRISEELRKYPKNAPDHHFNRLCDIQTGLQKALRILAIHGCEHPEFDYFGEPD
jgi:hypothetical protein